MAADDHDRCVRIPVRIARTFPSQLASGNDHARDARQRGDDPAAIPSRTETVVVDVIRSSFQRRMRLEWERKSVETSDGTTSLRGVVRRAIFFFT